MRTTTTAPIVLSLVSLAAATLALARGAPAAGGTSAGGTAAARGAVAVPASDLARRLDALERALGRLEREAPLAEPREPLEADADAAAAPALAELEARVAQLEEVARAPARPTAASFEPAAGHGREPVDLLAFQGTANDPAAPDEARLAALRALRGRRDAYGGDARDAVALAMIELARTSADAAARADVWRQLHGVTDPALREPLLDALANDPVAKVREEAAETLDAFLPDAAVASALGAALKNDPDGGVRKQAAETLALGVANGLSWPWED